MTQSDLQVYLKNLPAKPGIYFFKNASGEVIYVGKAANLRNRVKSYFKPQVNTSEKIKQLVNQTEKIEFVVTESELAALILECQQIKKFRPRYNVLLKDDKSFPYIKIAVNDEWPSISITRKRYDDGAIYIGRVPSAASARQTYEFIKRIFLLRSCNRKISGRHLKPCLKFHIRRCLGPCTGAVTKADYDDMVKHAISFLQGKEESVLSDLKKDMAIASKNLQYEKAARLRDQIQAIKSVIQSQQVTLNVKGEKDVIAMARAEDIACVRIFSLKDSKLIEDQHFMLEDIAYDDNGLILESFFKQYYSTAAHIPDQILVQHKIQEMDLIARWLQDMKGTSVKINIPSRGSGQRLIEMVSENAEQELSLYKAKRSVHMDNIGILNNLKQILNLPKLPSRIEAYDISNIQGNRAVGSMAVFEHGLPSYANYRRFKIRTVEGVDDYSMIREVLQRRFKGHAEGGDNWSATPDLVIIDGGKGHLNVAAAAMKQMGVASIPVVSLAKENEELYTIGRKNPLDLDKASPASQLLQRIRDEAHRFAITYHRKLRAKESLGSILDTVSGIGPKRKKALIRRFGSVNDIKHASIEDLTSVSGITSDLAKRILETLVS